MRHATLLVANPAANLNPTAVSQTQCEQAQWPHLLIQTHREPAHVAPTLMEPVPELQLILRTAGASQMTLTAGGHVRRFRPRPGDLFLTAAHQPPYQMQRESLCGQPVETTHLYLGSQLLTQTAAETLGVDEAAVKLSEGSCLRDPLLRHLTLALSRELASPAAGSRLFTDTAAQLVAAQLLRRHCTVRYALPERGGRLAPARLRQLTDYIQAQLTQPISLSELAGLACLSPYHFCRVFKRTTGLSPNQYVINQRLSQARHLLGAGHSVQQVAAAVGYEDSARHFAQLFRRYAGCTPAQYRQRRA
ncbi:MAG: AraC family transcriptional regulator [Hymenobacter sp.]